MTEAGPGMLNILCPAQCRTVLPQMPGEALRWASWMHKLSYCSWNHIKPLLANRCLAYSLFSIHVVAGPRASLSMERLTPETLIPEADNSESWRIRHSSSALSLGGVTVVLSVPYGLPSLSTSLSDLCQCHLLKSPRQRNLPTLFLAVTFSLPVVLSQWACNTHIPPSSKLVLLWVMWTQKRKKRRVRPGSSAWNWAGIASQCGGRELQSYK